MKDEQGASAEMLKPLAVSALLFFLYLRTFAASAGGVFWGMSQHEHFMQMALEEARIASQQGEIPVGAVLVCEGVVVATSRNRVEQLNNPTAHAELLLIQEATATQQQKWLHECALYVTLEPCPMCAGAILLARIPKLYFGAFDAKTGAAGTLFCLTTDPRLNHSVETWGGICANQSIQLLQQFFREQRKAT